MTNYGRHFAALATPQTEPAKPGQVQNSAGGYTFKLDPWARLDRWLILGAEGGTYYASERAVTRDNARTIAECLAADGPRTVATIAAVSESGRAPKNDPALFALAMAAGDPSPATRAAALAALPRVARIGTHLFHFARDVEGFRRWGRGLRSAVARWYASHTAERLAYDAAKYQARDGWSHRDLLRLSHARAATPAHEAVHRWIVAGMDGLGAREVRRGGSSARYGATAPTDLPRILHGLEAAKRETDPKAIARLVREYGLTHEMVPSEAKNSADVWAALLESMPLSALVRNLAKMTAVGLVAPLSEGTARVVARLSDGDAIRKARLHPIALLSALRVYAQGHGEKGKLAWAPERAVVDALDTAFYAAFAAIEPSGRSTLLALDVSGSMNSGTIAGCPGISPRVGAAAMAMATARTEPNWHVMAFSGGFVPLTISPRQRLDDIVSAMDRMPFDRTDCALPMVYARTRKIPVDTFVVYTDNETFHGGVHPFQALRDYRQAMGRDARLVVVGMTATEFTIADPSDAGMLDVVGFDSSAPAVMADFARRDLRAAIAGA